MFKVGSSTSGFTSDAIVSTSISGSSPCTLQRISESSAAATSASRSVPVG